jgi:hypothetical protein
MQQKEAQEREDQIVNDIESIKPNVNLGFIQGALIPARFGPIAGNFYGSAQAGVLAADIYQSGGAEALGEAGLATVTLYLILRPGAAEASFPGGITMGDVKSIDDYYRGLRALSEMEGRGRYNTSGNTALALYDAATGEVYLQIFGRGDTRRIIAEGWIGRIDIPQGLTPMQIGNAVEEPVRNLVGRVVGQSFPTKAPNAHGPDLHIPQW